MHPALRGCYDGRSKVGATLLLFDHPLRHGVGYAKLVALSPQAAERALAAARAMTERLPADLSPDQEPATVYLPNAGEEDD